MHYNAKHHGIFPDDPGILAWRRTLPHCQEKYKPLPEWKEVPSPFFEEGRRAFATDGSTQNPTFRKIRYSGVGIFAGKDSPWNWKGPLLGPTQQNDKAELMAALHLVENIQRNSQSFPQGVVIWIDNEWVANTAQHLSSNPNLRKPIAHWALWLRLCECISKVNSGFFKFQWIPSHRSEKDILQGTITRIQAEANGAADELADEGAKLNECPKALLDNLLFRQKIAPLVQKMLAAISIARGAKEKELIKKELDSNSVISLGNISRPAVVDALAEVVNSFPNYCWCAGTLLATSVLPSIPSKSLTEEAPVRLLRASIWYWSHLKWPHQPHQANRGATWVEIALDFLVTTGISRIGTKHTPNTSLCDAAAAFSKVMTHLEAAAQGELYPAKRARGTPLQPFGINGTWWGLSVAPQFLSIEVWGPYLAAAIKDAASPTAALKAIKVRDLPKRTPPLYLPMQTAFAAFARNQAPEGPAPLPPGN